MKILYVKHPNKDEVIGKKIGKKYYSLDETDIKFLKSKNIIIDDYIDGNYIKIDDNNNKCYTCDSKDIKIISLTRFEDCIINIYYINGYCLKCFIDYESCSGCGPYSIIYALINKGENEWVNIHYKIDTKKYYSEQLNDVYYKKFPTVIKSIHPYEVMNFIKTKNAQTCMKNIISEIQDWDCGSYIDI